MVQGARFRSARFAGQGPSISQRKQRRRVGARLRAVSAVYEMPPMPFDASRVRFQIQCLGSCRLTQEGPGGCLRCSLASGLDSTPIRDPEHRRPEASQCTSPRKGWSQRRPLAVISARSSDILRTAQQSTFRFRLM